MPNHNFVKILQEIRNNKTSTNTTNGFFTVDINTLQHFGNEEKNLAAEDLVKALAFNTQIKKLSFSGDYGVGDSFCMNLLEALKGNYTIEEIDFTDQCLSEKCEDSIIDFLVHRSNVVLNVSNNNLPSFVEMLKRAESLAVDTFQRQKSGTLTVREKVDEWLKMGASDFMQSLDDLTSAVIQTAEIDDVLTTPRSTISVEDVCPLSPNHKHHNVIK